MNDFNKVEILQIIDSVSRERGIAKSSLIETMEQAIQSAARKQYGADQNIVVQINQNTGKISLFRAQEIVENLENNIQQILLQDAKAIRPDAKIGEQILDPLPPIELGRVAAQSAKRVIVQKVDEIERTRQYNDYKDRKGDILNGTVKRIEHKNIIVDVGRAEAVLPYNQQIRGEIFQIGDRIKAFVSDVRLEQKGSQIFLSRTNNDFLKKLFEMEVPEIYDNIIQIKSLSREPGSKAKVAVVATDVSIDPVGSCVGVRGNRVRAITNELSGEKIDIIHWDANLAQFIINSMTPAEIIKIIFDEENKRAEAIVPDDQLSMAIGRRGQNVRLASEITGWSIDVMTEEQESKRRTKEFADTTELFAKNLEVEEVIAQLLSAEGYTTIEQVAYSDDTALESIEGFDDDLVKELKSRAITYLEQQNDGIIEKLEQLGVEQELLDLLDLPPEYILDLAQFGIKTVEDLAEVTSNEFREVVPESVINSENIDKLIDFAKARNDNNL